MTAARWLAAPAVAAVFAAGVWVAGAAPDRFRTAMALVAVWYAAAGAAALAVAWRSRSWRAPVLAGFLASAAVIGAFLAWTTLRDRVVHERVSTGATLATGAFRSLEHPTRGSAAVVRAAGGRRFLTLTGFRTSPGPDLRVRLVPGDSTDGATAGARDLGALKGNVGDQQYALPAGLDLARFGGVLIWCRAFSAAFAQARI